MARVGRELYEKMFRGYTRKQWGLDPSELDASVTARIPVRTNRDDRYFTDTYQAMPLHGYTRMFENMLDHPNIKIMLNTDYREIREEIAYKRDGLLRAGRRVTSITDSASCRTARWSSSMRCTTREFFQVAPVVNYPQEHAYTRITEFKYLTGQKHPKTAIVYEFPRAEGDPYYPVPRPENALLYKQYEALAQATPERPFRRAARDLQVLQHGSGSGPSADVCSQTSRRTPARSDTGAGHRAGSGYRAGSKRRDTVTT